MTGGRSFRPLLILAALAGLSFLLLEEEEDAPRRPGPRAEVRGIVLDRFERDGRIQLSAERAVFSPDGVLRLQTPKLRTMRGGDDFRLESAEGEMAPEYEELHLRDIRGEVGDDAADAGAGSAGAPLVFRGERMRYVLATGELSGGMAQFERDGQSFAAGEFTYAPETGAKFSGGVTGIFTPRKK